MLLRSRQKSPAKAVVMDVANATMVVEVAAMATSATRSVASGARSVAIAMNATRKKCRPTSQPQVAANVRSAVLVANARVVANARRPKP